MLAEINLLPQKQQRNYTNLVVVLVMAIILSGVCSTIFTFISQKNQQFAELEQTYQQLQQQSNVLQQQASQESSSKAVAELEEAIKWSEEFPVDFVPLLQELTKKLPDKGLFYSLDYVNNASLNLVVQFESSREAAYYLSRLKSSELMTEVKLLTVEAVPLEDAEDAVPRYLATYQLQIDRNALKAVEEEDEEQ